MDIKERMAQTCTPFVEEIDYSEIEILEIVGKGSFGVVNKGKWRGKFVAVKKIEGESEKKAFIVERQQLSRVDHPNIVKLYGACTKSPVCLVMEYAEGGSLYNILHATPTANYTASHAMSWALQCAKGVSYLHNMKPKALIHRDLKPPNLLLIMGGTMLKICDFGTACDIQTHMTNNKGSAAWMAPEVFEGCSYSEKCDVFSWGIILWEVLTRHKPFGEHGATAYSIMWAVHIGERPQLIQGCPIRIEKLMTRCWDKNPQRRPPMHEVVETMTELFKFCKGADEPITYTVSDDENYSTSYQSDELGTVSEEALDQSIQNLDLEEPPAASTVAKNDTDANAVTLPQHSPPARWVGDKNVPPTVLQPISVVVDEKFEPTPVEAGIALNPRLMSQTSAPPSLSSSRENLSVTSPIKDNQKRLSADLTPLANKGLMEKISDSKKTGSYGSLVTKSIETKLVPKTDRPPSQPTHQMVTLNQDFTNTSHALPICGGSPQDYATSLGYYRLMLEPQYQPLSPFPKSNESMKVFEQHKKMAEQYIRVQAETSLLLKRKQELMNELSKDVDTVTSGNYTEADKYINEMLELQNEKASLEEFRQKLTKQLEMLKKNPKDRHLNDDWVLLG